MKVGDMVESPHHTIRGIVVEVGDVDEHYNESPVRVKWFDGDDSLEWADIMMVISEGR